MVRRSKNEDPPIRVYYSGKDPAPVVEWLKKNAAPEDYEIKMNKGKIETIAFGPSVFRNEEFRVLLGKHKE